MILGSIVAFAENDKGRLDITVSSDNENYRAVIVSSDDYSYLTVYYKNDNYITISEISNQNIVSTVVIYLDKIMTKNENTLWDTIQDLKNEGTRIAYEHTFSDFEYEEYMYDDYPGDAFWFLKNPHFSPNERTIYEHPINLSMYSTSIDEYVDAVETINEAEVWMGIFGALVVALWVASSGIIPAVQIAASVASILEALDITMAFSAVMGFAEAIETCDQVWLEVFDV